MNNNQPKTIGERIKFLREKNNETQIQLAKVLKTSQKNVSDIETGSTHLNIEKLIKIAKHYHVSTDYICTGIDSGKILEQLQKYISLKYTYSTNGENNYKYPVFEINTVFFNYLVQSSHAKQEDIFMDEEIRKNWLDKITRTFYENNTSNDFKQNTAFVPVPEKLIFPDGNKINWKPSDLIREIQNEFIKVTTKGEQ